MALDLGDRQVELVHPGRGHTAGDLVVRVPDADVLLAGDLVEESAVRQGVPGFGDDCYPMEWPLSLDIVLGLTTPTSVVVPGHGAPVDRDFVEEQRNAIGVVAETIRDLATRGVPVDRRAGGRRVAVPAGGAGRTRCAAATSTSRAPRSGCRSCERVPPGMSNNENESLGIDDEQLPDDLVPSEDNPLAESLDPDEAKDVDLLGEGKDADESASDDAAEDTAE